LLSRHPTKGIVHAVLRIGNLQDYHKNMGLVFQVCIDVYAHLGTPIGHDGSVRLLVYRYRWQPGGKRRLPHSAVCRRGWNMSVSLITLFPLCTLSVHGRERGLEFIGLYMRFFISKRILPETSNTVYGFRTPLACQKKAGGIRTVV
jgi:hypothetical protein